MIIVLYYIRLEAIDVQNHLGR